jgi:hypothetical protein
MLDKYLKQISDIQEIIMRKIFVYTIMITIAGIFTFQEMPACTNFIVTKGASLNGS